MANQQQGNQNQKQAQGGQDSMGRKPSDPGYDGTSDPSSPTYDATKTAGEQGQRQGR